MLSCITSIPECRKREAASQNFTCLFVIQSMPPSQSSEPAVSVSSDSQKRARAEGEEIAVPDDLKCQICLNLLDDAVQLPCCGAPCCRSCIDTWLLVRAQQSCINCRSPIKSCDLQRYVIPIPRSPLRRTPSAVCLGGSWVHFCWPAFRGWRAREKL